VDLRPATIDEVRRAMADAAGAGAAVTIRGGGTRCGDGATGDARVLHTTALTGVVEHTPAELTVTVLAGTDCAALSNRLAEAGQWWPQADIRPGSTVGGVIADAASGRRRLRYGPLRDSLLEVVLVTGDGRLVKGGGRTVKSVAGYDIPRLAAGSAGRLGVVVQATLKLTPIPPAMATFTARGSVGERRAAARAALRDLWRPASLVLSPGRLTVELAGTPVDVVAPEGFEPDDTPAHPLHGTALVAVGVPPSRVGDFADHVESRGLAYEAEVGTGVCRVAVEDAEQLAAVDDWARSAGGHATVQAGPASLTLERRPHGTAITEIERRLRAAFDPNAILRPAPRRETFA